MEQRVIGADGAGRGTPQWRLDNRYALPALALMWVLVVLMIVPDGFDYASLAAGQNPPEAGTPMSRALWLTLLGGSGLILLWRFPLALMLGRHLNLFLVLFALLAFASLFWSLEPALTLRRLVRVATILLTCVAVALLAWHGRRYQSVLRPILTIMLGGSLLFGLAYPELAIHQETSPELLEAWRGLANHKNGLGALACFGLIFWLHAGLAREVRTLPALLGCALAVTCLVLSRSSTAMMAALFVSVLLLLLLRSSPGLRPWLPWLVGLFALIVTLYVLAVLKIIPGVELLLAPVRSLTGKELSFTGRTDIWTILSEHIAQHPLLGAGYAAYWIGPRPGAMSYEFVVRMQSYYPGSAHNGYLEVLNELGTLGLLCLIGYILVHIQQSLQLLGSDRNQAALYLALVFQQAITNLSETHWFSVLSIDFVIMSFASAALARGLLDQRLRIWFGAPQVGLPPRQPPVSRPAAAWAMNARPRP